MGKHRGARAGIAAPARGLALPDAPQAEPVVKEILARAAGKNNPHQRHMHKAIAAIPVACGAGVGADATAPPRTAPRS